MGKIRDHRGYGELHTSPFSNHLASVDASSSISTSKRAHVPTIDAERHRSAERCGGKVVDGLSYLLGFPQSSKQDTSTPQFVLHCLFSIFSVMLLCILIHQATRCFQEGSPCHARSNSIHPDSICGPLICECVGQIQERSLCCSIRGEPCIWPQSLIGTVGDHTTTPSLQKIRQRGLHRRNMRKQV